MKKNDRIEVLIEGYTSEGYGVAKPGGYVLFIPGAIRGERVLAHVLKAKKSFGYAKIQKIIEPSRERILPSCSAAGVCGGCGLMHMSYFEELNFKRDKVEANLKKAGVLAGLENIYGSVSVTGYRNKAQYPVREQKGKIAVGFYRRASHDVAEGRCLIQPDIFDGIAGAVRGFMEENAVTAYNEQTLRGTVRHIYLRSSHDKKQIMLCLVVNGEFNLKDKLADFVSKRYPEVSTVLINYNNENTNVILGARFETVYGSGFITDELCGRRFEISAPAFYQVNHDSCEKLYSIAAEFAGADENSRVLDLYCGIGTVGICAAGAARELVGVEIVPQAVENARRNAAINGLENARFFACDAAGAENLGLGDFDIIFVDPPRRGCDRSTLEFILRSSPSKLVYISCDSATLSRDIAVLRGGGYEVLRAAAVDMFPRTHHVETVVLMAKTEKLEKMDVFFENRIDGYDRHMLENIRGADEFYRFTAGLLPGAAAASVVDLGCGTGLELEEYFKVNPDARVTGIDLSEAMLNVLAGKFPGKNIKLINVSYFDFQFEPESFDAAVSVESLHHFTPQQKLALYKRLHAALRSGGYFILTDYFAPSDQLEKEYFENYESLKKEQNITDGGFYHYDTPLTARHEVDILKEAGFSSVEILKSWENTCTIRALR